MPCFGNGRPGVDLFIFGERHQFHWYLPSKAGLWCLTVVTELCNVGVAHLANPCGAPFEKRCHSNFVCLLVHGVIEAELNRGCSALHQFNKHVLWNEWL